MEFTNLRSGYSVGGREVLPTGITLLAEPASPEVE